MSFAIAVIVMMCLGAVAGAGLAVAYRFFGVREDPRIENICDVLPGANCGACGYPGCREYAKAILTGKDICLCPAGGNETTQKIAEILGVEAEEMISKVAVVRCAGTFDVTSWRSEYRGVEDCGAAQLVQSGPTACNMGCLGFGTCADICPEDCITVEEGVAIVDMQRCTGCGLCVKECPRGIIELVPRERRVHVLCSNHQAGKDVRGLCKVGCTACKLCAKSSEWFVVENNLANVKEGVGKGGREAALVCPTGTIVDLDQFSIKELLCDPEARKELKKLQKEHKKKKRDAREAKKKVKKSSEAAQKSDKGGKNKKAGDEKAGDEKGKESSEAAGKSEKDVNEKNEKNEKKKTVGMESAEKEEAHI